MDDNVSVLNMTFGIEQYTSGTCVDLGKCPEGMEIDSINGNTDLNIRVIQKNITANIIAGDIVISMKLPRTQTATMHVTVWVGFKPEL